MFSIRGMVINYQSNNIPSGCGQYINSIIHFFCFVIILALDGLLLPHREVHSCCSARKVHERSVSGSVDS
ncbi:hypothetical protein I3760_14G048400 [Carya illinoinensis]|nr:hypothetical protein I3760_14G048400 [Carya illinoinensis]